MQGLAPLQSPLLGRLLSVRFWRLSQRNRLLRMQQLETIRVITADRTATQVAYSLSDRKERPVLLPPSIT